MQAEVEGVEVVEGEAVVVRAGVNRTTRDT